MYAYVIYRDLCRPTAVTNIHLISPGCPNPSIALHCRIRTRTPFIHCIFWHSFFINMLLLTSVAFALFTPEHHSFIHLLHFLTQLFHQYDLARVSIICFIYTIGEVTSHQHCHWDYGILTPAAISYKMFRAQVSCLGVKNLWDCLYLFLMWFTQY